MTSRLGHSEKKEDISEACLAGVDPFAEPFALRTREAIEDELGQIFFMAIRPEAPCHCKRRAPSHEGASSFGHRCPFGPSHPGRLRKMASAG